MAHSSIPDLEFLSDLPKASSFCLELNEFILIYDPAGSAKLLPAGTCMPNSCIDTLSDQIAL